MTTLFVDKKELETAIKTLIPFCSKEKTRYYIGGIYFHGKSSEGHLNLAATDGHKLCAMKLAINVAEDTGQVIGHIISTDALKTILQIIKAQKDDEAPITIVFDTAKMEVKTTAGQQGKFTRVDGNFPDYTKVISTEKVEYSIGLMKEQAVEAVKAVKTHKSKDPLLWEFRGEAAPIKMVSEGKVVVIMPCRTAITESVFGF